MYSPDQEYPAEDPGNQLRMKLNGVPAPRATQSFSEVMNTARERLGVEVDDEDALKVVHLFQVAQQIDAMPGDELERIRM